MCYTLIGFTKRENIMRDILITLIVVIGCLYTLKKAYIGVLLWSWLSYMNPHRLAYGFAYNMPFAQITALVLLLSMIFSKEKQAIPINSLTFIWGCFIVWMGITTLLAYYPDAAYIQFKKVIKIQLMTVLTMILIDNMTKLRQLIWVIVLSISYYSVKGGVFTLLTGGTYRVWGPPGSFIEDNNTLAVAVLMVIALMMYLYQTAEKKWVKNALIFMVIFSLFTVLGSQSRGALLAIIAVGGFYWLKSKSKVYSGIFIAIAAVALLSFMPDSWYERMHTIENYEEFPDRYQLNGARMFFRLINNNNEYPIKAICRECFNGLELNENFTTNEAKNKLRAIFRRTSIEFIELTKPLPQFSNKIKNIILYGVPGVGKTYSHKKIIDLIESKKYSDNKIFKKLEIHNNLDSFITAEKENRVKFITFHQSFGYEDFIEGFRPDESGNIKLEDGVFKNIAEMARKNLNKSKSDNTAIDFEGIIKKFQIDNEIGTVLKTVKGNDFEIINYTSKSIHIKVNDNKFSISYAPLEKILLSSKKVKINRPADVIDVLDGAFKGLSTYYFPIFEKLLKYNAENLQKENRKNFYLVIDEINRGNISKIFGELITLIEADKRDSLHVTLPYSKDEFSIPSNLYIIGTMNSTDKSIALIDIALRRRFTFIHMKPNPELVTKYPEAKELMIALNSQLEDEHKLGHSYFIKIENNEDLIFTCKYKIKPLLEEYFYGDKDGLIKILELLPI